MKLDNFRFETDADGIALLTWDMPGRSMNVITAEVMAELGQVVDHVAGTEAIKGCVITSGKEAFSGGADLTMLQGLGIEYHKLARTRGEEAAMQFFFDATAGLSRLYSKLETSGKPFAAAVHGTCLGGAFELALSCHYRVVSDSDKTRVGLPEITIRDSSASNSDGEEEGEQPSRDSRPQGRPDRPRGDGGRGPGPVSNQGPGPKAPGGGGQRSRRGRGR